MCILEKLNFKISRRSMLPDPLSLLVPLALDPTFAGLTLNCFRRACYYQLVNTQYNITYLNYTKRWGFFSLEKGAPSVLYRNIYTSY